MALRSLSKIENPSSEFVKPFSTDFTPKLSDNSQNPFYNAKLPPQKEASLAPFFASPPTSPQEIDIYLGMLQSGDPKKIGEAVQYFQDHMHEIPPNRKKEVIAALTAAGFQFNAELGKIIAILSLEEAKIIKEIEKWSKSPKLQSLELLLSQLQNTNGKIAREALIGLAQFLDASAFKLGLETVKNFFATNASAILQPLLSVARNAITSVIDLDVLSSVFRIFRFGIKFNLESVASYLATALEILLTLHTGGMPLIVRLLLSQVPKEFKEIAGLINTIVKYASPEDLERHLSTLFGKEREAVLQVLEQLRKIEKESTKAASLARAFLEKLPSNSKFFSPATAVTEERVSDEFNAWLEKLKSPDPKIRAEAAEALGNLYNKLAVAPLLACLQDESAEVRQKVAQSLGKLGDERALEPLNILMKEDEVLEVRREAALALGRLGDKRAVEPLLSFLENQSLSSKENEGLQNEHFRFEAIGVLQDLGDKRAMIPLIRRLKDDYYLARARAASALGQFGDTQAVGPLIERLGDETEDVRAAAALTLGKLGDKRAVEPLAALLKTEEDNNIIPDVRGAVGYALVSLGDERGIEPLVASLAKHGDSRREGIAILGNLNNKRATKSLIRFLKDEDAYTRRVAFQVLNRLTDEADPFPLLEEPSLEVANGRNIWTWRIRGKNNDRDAGSLLNPVIFHSPEVVILREDRTEKAGKKYIKTVCGKKEEKSENMERVAVECPTPTGAVSLTIDRSLKIENDEDETRYTVSEWQYVGKHVDGSEIASGFAETKSLAYIHPEQKVVTYNDEAELQKLLQKRFEKLNPESYRSSDLALFMGGGLLSGKEGKEDRFSLFAEVFSIDFAPFSSDAFRLHGDLRAGYMFDAGQDKDGEPKGFIAELNVPGIVLSARGLVEWDPNFDIEGYLNPIHLGKTPYFDGAKIFVQGGGCFLLSKFRLCGEYRDDGINSFGLTAGYKEAFGKAPFDRVEIE